MSGTGRVRTAWSDPEHMRLVHDLDERIGRRPAERLRGTPPDDPWATGGDGNA